LRESCRQVLQIKPELEAIILFCLTSFCWFCNEAILWIFPF